MLAEYLMLALSVGLLGRAARRLARHTRVQRHLLEFARGLTPMLDPDAVLRQAVEASVRLSGADGGFVVAATDAGWWTEAVFRAGGHWRVQPLTWGPPGTAPWEESAAGRWQLCEAAVTRDLTLRELGAGVAVAVPVADAGPRPRYALVVFRAERRRFTPPTREVLELLGLHVGAALQAATLYRTATGATADKGRILAHLAHELTVPLHVVVGSLEQLAPHVDDVGRSALERLERQERLLLEMTQNLLEYARLEAGRAAVRCASVDLPALYAEVRELAEPLIGNKDVRLAVRVDPGAEQVESDREKLRRILANLAINAVKYTPAGRIELCAARENGAVRLAVRDTGPGIPLHEQPRLFEPFYRGGDGTAPGAGVGLGLALAQELAHLLGTEIVVESREHEGTSFSLVLPGGAPDSEPSRARVLIVDDDPETRAMSAEALCDRYDVACAATSAEALRRVQERVPDAIVVDVMLGSESGWELIRALQGDPRCGAAPIVVLSARAQFESPPGLTPLCGTRPEALSDVPAPRAPRAALGRAAPQRGAVARRKLGGRGARIMS